MQKLEFKVNNNIELIKAVIDKLPFLSRYDVEKLLSNKDIKVNNVRTKENIMLNQDDLVVVYYNPKEQDVWYSEVYVDNNILIVNKRAGIEVVSETERDLVGVLKQRCKNVLPVHRLDRNTEGLVIFALNNIAEKELLDAFKTRNGILKKYALLVHGRVDVNKLKRTVYLKKVDHLSKVWISEVKTSGYEPIITEFELVEYRGDCSLLEAKLITGKTHQIRAHISYFGYPIVGDQKYGKDKEKQLHLTAYNLSFCFKKGSLLSYLNSKNFEIIPSWL